MGKWWKRAKGGSTEEESEGGEGWEASGGEEEVESGRSASGGSAASEETAFELRLGKGPGLARLSWAHALESGLLRRVLEAGEATVTLDLGGLGELPTGRIYRSLIHELFILSAQPEDAKEELHSLSDPKNIGIAIQLGFRLELPKALAALASAIDIHNMEAVVELLANGQHIQWALDNVSSAIAKTIHIPTQEACGLFRKLSDQKSGTWSVVFEAVFTEYKKGRGLEAAQQIAEPGDLLLNWTKLLPPLACPVCFLSLKAMAEALLDAAKTNFVQTTAISKLLCLDWPTMMSVVKTMGAGQAVPPANDLGLKFRRWMEQSFNDCFEKKLGDLEELRMFNINDINQLNYMGHTWTDMTSEDVPSRDETLQRVITLLRRHMKDNKEAKTALDDLLPIIDRCLSKNKCLLQQLRL